MLLLWQIKERVVPDILHINVSKSKQNVCLVSERNPNQQVSRSKEKLENPLFLYYSNTDDSEYELINISMLNFILKEVAVCKLCHGSLTVDKKSLA